MESSAKNLARGERVANSNAHGNDGTEVVSRASDSFSAKWSPRRKLFLNVALAIILWGALIWTGFLLF
jgi:hypothetical protein